MNDPQNKRSLVDDPSFLASLEKLDSGLGSEPVVERRPSPVRPALPTPPSPRPQPPRATQPRAARPAIDNERPAPPHAAPAPLAPAAAAPGGRRPLLDLFPPTSEPTIVERAEPPRPAPAAAPPRSARVPAPPRAASTRRSALDLLGAEPPAPLTPVSETITYETFYGLTEKPFSLSSDPRFLYHSTSHDRAAQELLSAIRRREGIVVLTGETGLGKTTLCRAVIDQLDRRTLTSFVLDPFVSVEELLKTILVDFGVISREELTHAQLSAASRDDLTGTLKGFLASLAALEAFAVVVVDEAENLTADVLEQLRVLSDAQDGRRLLQVILVGRPALLTRLTRGDLQGIAQRVAVRCRLDPLAEDDVAGYVAHRLHVAGTSARVEFDDGALSRIYALTGGVPRLMNLVCDRALTLGYDAAASAIDERLVDRAAEDLDIAPSESRATATVRAAVTALVLICFILAGAAGAAYLFKDRIARVMVEWQHVPPLPRTPSTDKAAPIAPLPLPPPASPLPEPRG